MSKVIRVRYERGVLKLLGLREGEEVEILLEEGIVAFARRVRRFVRAGREEPGELLSRERGRFKHYG